MSLLKTISLSCSFLHIFKIISHRSYPRRSRHKYKTPSRDYVTGLGCPLSLLDGGKLSYEIFPSRYGGIYTPIFGEVKKKLCLVFRSRRHGEARPQESSSVSLLAAVPLLKFRRAVISRGITYPRDCLQKALTRQRIPLCLKGKPVSCSSILRTSWTAVILPLWVEGDSLLFCY